MAGSFREPMSIAEPAAYPVGMTPTLADVARAAGVHPGTASRALNPQSRGRVAPATVKRVLAEAERLGYQPNAVARGLRTRRSFSVGLLIPDLTNPLFPPIVRGVEEVLRPIGYNAWIVNTDSRPDVEKAAVESFRQRNVEGFVFATAHLKYPLLDEL